MTVLITFIQKAIGQAVGMLFGATGEIITEKSGNLNLGIPGMMYMGGIAGLMGAFFYEKTAQNPNGVVGLLISFLCAVLCAAFGGLIYSVLTITLRANQNVAGLALTTFGVGFGNFFGGSISKLAGGVAVIRVGAATETEMKEAKLRMEDALNATRAAVEEGIIAGGGSAYIHASKEVAKLAETLEGDEKTGANIILKALEAPLFHIATNAGLEGAVIINKVRESEPGVGFDAYKEEYVDMVSEGILDPAKVTRSALQNANSVASTLLTTESVVSTIKEETPAMPAAPGGMGMM